LKVIVIAGATASGKSAAAAALARKLDGEVVSADSMQVYRHMDIGTAKPTCDEMQGIPHHLLDVVNPCEPFSAARYRELAEDAIRDIHNRGKTPILAGGTGFYINAVLYGVEFSDVAHKEESELRQRFTGLAHEKGAEYLHGLLCEKDPEYAAGVHPNNIKRVARALAYNESTGRRFSDYNAAQKANRLLFDTSYCVLTMNRDILYSRINDRTIAMFRAGLEDEVRGLLNNYHEGLAAMQGIGYKETVKLIKGEYTLPEAISAIQQSTRNYAKRQETWFRHQASAAQMLNAEGKTPSEIAKEISRRIYVL